MHLHFVSVGGPEEGPSRDTKTGIIVEVKVINRSDTKLFSYTQECGLWQNRSK